MNAYICVDIEWPPHTTRLSSLSFSLTSSIDIPSNWGMSETSDCPADGNFICTDYLFLKPEKATLFDLVRLLWSKDKQKHSFIETTHDLEQELKNFCYRWIVFISIWLQKILRFFGRPMALVGRVIEFLVNLVYDNGGFLKLLINIITGIYT